jgi:hypothetical protein
MSEDKHYEEKDEKELQKHDEKVEENDVLSSVVWALILIWAGLVFLASNMDWFARIGLAVDNRWVFHSLNDLNHFGVWNLIALGAGAIVLFEAVIRLLVPNFRRHVGGALIGGAVLIGVGLGGWFSWSYLWPLILIAVGINVLITGLGRKRE